MSQNDAHHYLGLYKEEMFTGWDYQATNTPILCKSI